MTTLEADARDRADMEKLQAGHAAALDDLMERHAPAVFGFLARMLQNEDDANDLAQETFVRVYRARDRFQPDLRFSTWLFTIAANLARNQIRWRTRHPNVSLNAELSPAEPALADTLPAHEPSPREQTVAEERAAAVRAAVNDLPADLREAIVLCEWEEHSLNAAAALVGTTPKAIESRLYRARRQLREKLHRWL
jgi:RNA polymerase sigma-70 factor (ECF subfamily)